MTVLLFFMQRLYRNHFRTGRVFSSWRLPLILFIVVFFGSWGAMALAEPSNPLIKGQNFFWYFTVTATTVGYGDYFPHTEAGHIVGEFFIVGAITCGTVLLGYLLNIILDRRDKYSRGRATMDLAGHIVILGYKPDRTRRLITLLRAQDDPDKPRQIVVCAPEAELGENPFRDLKNVHPISGSIIEPDTLERCGPISHAAYCIADVIDDNEALTVAACLMETAPDLHLAVTFGGSDRLREIILRLGMSNLELVAPTDLAVIADIALTPGIGNFLDDLKTAGGNVNSEVLTVDASLAGMTIRELRDRLEGYCLTQRPDCGTAITYLKTVGGAWINMPGPNTTLREGELVGYFAAVKVEPMQLIA